ncbi:DUF3869 domain-containing protein [uncultured Bacteroides sp.]|jgi:hypothetical protein|uniref:DUF3869 domain-containing protein n=1 Tax=uncultured Bacteroides sp. TaxID=162156 RepID=UPI00260D7608|nr:DUF3869 domain-containing protein [uncultured Bacteroides sp.]
MKKKSFLNGLYAKGALALTIVAGFTLAGCEKEDFSIEVPPINITTPVVKVGKVAVTLSATSASGNTLDVKFSKDGTELKNETTLEFEAAAQFTITAEKDGYNTVVKTVNVPAPAEGTYSIIPVSFVLSAVEAPVEIPTPSEEDKVEGGTKVDNDTKTYAGEYEANKSYTIDVQVPTGTFYTAEQKIELLKAVEALKGPDEIGTRAGEGEEALANLNIAKNNLRTTINALPTTPNTTTQSVTFTLTDAAKSVIFAIETTSDVYKVTFSTAVAGKKYSVEGEQLQVAKTDIKPTAEGVEIDHGHGHGHGNGGNAGGGIGGK